MRIGKSVVPEITYEMEGMLLGTVMTEKDRGIIVDNQLNFEEHLSEKI